MPVYSTGTTGDYARGLEICRGPGIYNYDKVLELWILFFAVELTTFFFCSPENKWRSKYMYLLFYFAVADVSFFLRKRNGEVNTCTVLFCSCRCFFFLRKRNREVNTVFCSWRRIFFSLKKRNGEVNNTGSAAVFFCLKNIFLGWQ